MVGVEEEKEGSKESDCLWFEEELRVEGVDPFARCPLPPFFRDREDVPEDGEPPPESPVSNPFDPPPPPPPVDERFLERPALIAALLDRGTGVSSYS